MKIRSLPQVYRNVNRWGQIISVLSKYGLADWISRFDLKFARGLLKARDGATLANLTRETRIRLALSDLGPTFIKMGQIFSTRPDLIGAELATELELLQTEVPADPLHVVRATIENELGSPVEELFQQFDSEPLASASIGQVHRAQLKTGAWVVVKVQHRNIDQQLRIDLDILAGLAQLADKLPEFENYRPVATVEEFRRTIKNELDFSRELRNLQLFGKQFANNPKIKIPFAYPELSSRRVLTMELLEGIQLSDVESLKRTGKDVNQLARNGVDLYLDMIFSDGRFHADPHPGNILILKNDVIGLIDFGMIGRIDERLREATEELLIAFAAADSDRLTSIITRLGSVPAELDHSSLEMDVADFVAHYAYRPINEIDFTGAITELLELIRRYRIMLLPRMALLFKTLLMLDGTARLLDPKFNLMEVMKPYRLKMMFRQVSPARHLKKLRKFSSKFMQLTEDLPSRVTEILEKIQSGKFDVHLDHRGLETSVNRLVMGMLASALFLGSSLMLSRNVKPFLYSDVSLPGTIGLVISVVLAMRIFRAIRKSGRLDRNE